MDAHPFALLGRLGGYFFIGDGRLFGTREWTRPLAKLYLRINDDVPGNGRGEFTCVISVSRAAT